MGEDKEPPPYASTAGKYYWGLNPEDQELNAKLFAHDPNGELRLKFHFHTHEAYNPETGDLYEFECHTPDHICGYGKATPTELGHFLNQQPNMAFSVWLEEYRKRKAIVEQIRKSDSLVRALNEVAHVDNIKFVPGKTEFQAALENSPNLAPEQTQTVPIVDPATREIVGTAELSHDGNTLYVKASLDDDSELAQMFRTPLGRFSIRAERPKVIPEFPGFRKETRPLGKFEKAVEEEVEKIRSNFTPGPVQFPTVSIPKKEYKTDRFEDDPKNEVAEALDNHCRWMLANGYTMDDVKRLVENVAKVNVHFDDDMFKAYIEALPSRAEVELSVDCMSTECEYQEPHKHGFACTRNCVCNRHGRVD